MFSDFCLYSLCMRQNSGDRIRIAMEKRNVKQIQLANESGLSTGMISSYLSGKFEPKITAIEKMARVLKVSPSWLGGFDVPMEECLTEYDPENGILTIPFISQKISAGIGEEYLPDDCLSIKKIDILKHIARGVDKTSLVCAEVKGDSMIGANIYPNDYVIFSRGMIDQEGIYVISLMGEVMVKRLLFDSIDNKVTIISENKNYPPKTTSAENVRILGKVIGWIHNEY